MGVERERKELGKSWSPSTRRIFSRGQHGAERRAWERLGLELGEGWRSEMLWALTCRE